jgi:hypothetical protein
MRLVGAGDLRIGFCGGLAVACGERREQAALDGFPELAYFRVRLLHQQGLELGGEVRFGPEIPTFVVILLELDKPLAVLCQRGRIAQRQGRFEIGFDHIFGWWQDVRDEVVAELDAVVERAAHLEMVERKAGGADDRTQTNDGSDAEDDDCARERELEIHWPAPREQKISGLFTGARLKIIEARLPCITHGKVVVVFRLQMDSPHSAAPDAELGLARS